jgi:hypothetical protein
MSNFDQIAGALGGPQQAQRTLDRWAQGQAQFDDPQSPELNRWNELMGAAPPQLTQEAFEQAARQVDDREYREHITPGVRGTDPLGMLDKGALGSIAGALLSQLIQSRMGGGQAGRMGPMGGGAGGAGGGASGIDISDLIPGVRTNDPRQMTPDEVARMAEYLKTHHPEAFGRAASEIGQRQPNLLEALLGNKALVMGAAVLGAKILGDLAANRRVGGQRSGPF